MTNYSIQTYTLNYHIATTSAIRLIKNKCDRGIESVEVQKMKTTLYGLQYTIS